MAIKLNPDLFPFVRDLRTAFPNAAPMAQARMLARAQRHGVSVITLAGMVGCDESHVSNLLKLLTLPLAEQREIEGGANYEPYLELLRKIKREREKDAHAATSGTRAAERGGRTLRKWCEEIGWEGPYAEQVLSDVKAAILGAEAEKYLPESTVLWSGSAKAAFEAHRPHAFERFRGIDRINASIRWIARALVQLMPNAAIRYRALNLALAQPRASVTH